MKGRLEKYTIPVLLVVVLLLAATVAWLVRARADAAARRDASAEAGAGWYAVGVYQSTFFLDRAIQMLGGGDTDGALQNAQEAEFALDEARTGGTLFAVASGSTGKFRFDHAVGLYGSELKVWRVRLQRDRVLDAEGRQFLQDALDDLRVLSQASPKEFLMAASPDELQNRLFGLRGALKVQAVRDWLENTGPGAREGATR